MTLSFIFVEQYFNKYTKSVLVISLMCFWTFSLKAQINSDTYLRTANTIADNLVAEGFQNIEVRQSNNNLIVGYENRVYRFDALALSKVIQITKESGLNFPDSMNQVTFVTKRSNIPMLSKTLSFKDNQFYAANGSRDVSIFKAGKSIIRSRNSGNFRAELVLRPYLSMELGNLYLGDNFIHLIDLRPKLNLYLWKGAIFTYEAILPISNEFKTQAPQWSEIRPRVIAFNQRFRLPKATFISASVGLFSRSRYGISGQIGKYFWKDRLWVTAKAGYTGHLSYVRFNGREVQKGWIYTDADYFDYKVGLNYWLPKYNTQLSVEYGKVLFDRTALFFKCKQQFKELDLAFYLYRTDEGRNYGMQISIPIFPKKYWKPKLFSVRPSRKFSYNYLSGFDNARQVNLAREYQFEGMHNDFPQDLNPYFLDNYLDN